MEKYVDAELKAEIIGRFERSYFDTVEEVLGQLVSRWEIEMLERLEFTDANLVLRGLSKILGPVVLKFGKNPGEIRVEAFALHHFRSDAIVSLYTVDPQGRALVEEAVEPGSTLREEKDVNLRLAVFCSLFKRLHRKERRTVKRQEPAYRPITYKDWVFRACEDIAQRESWCEVADHMKRAKKYFIDLSGVYRSAVLLHGDFHYYNILKGKNGYVVIDPKGVIGDPIFDIPRYMLNEFWDQQEDQSLDTKMEKVFSVIGRELGIPTEVLRRLLYIEGALAMSWMVEGGLDPDNQEAVLRSLDKLLGYSRED